jgi:hypothetical protein
MPEAKIAPSMLSSDFANLAVEAKRMVKNGADWLHLGKKQSGVLYSIDRGRLRSIPIHGPTNLQIKRSMINPCPCVVPLLQMSWMGEKVLPAVVIILEQLIDPCISVRSHFVPNLTMGAPIISCLRKHTDAFFGRYKR